MKENRYIDFRIWYYIKCTNFKILNYLKKYYSELFLILTFINSNFL